MFLNGFPLLLIVRAHLGVVPVNLVSEAFVSVRVTVHTSACERGLRWSVSFVALLV